MLLPSPSSSGRRARKWRPFGSRRRRQQGSHRRGMKRNIPTTPVKQYFRARHRSVAGDSTCNNFTVTVPPLSQSHTFSGCNKPTHLSSILSKKLRLMTGRVFEFICAPNFLYFHNCQTVSKILGLLGCCTALSSLSSIPVCCGLLYAI
jgi:hypothetical protein